MPDVSAKNARLGKKWEHIRLLISEREYIELLAWMDQNFMASNSYIMRNNMIDEHCDGEREKMKDKGTKRLQ